MFYYLYIWKATKHVNFKTKIHLNICLIMRSLTKAEEEVMQILWEVKESSVKDLIKLMPEPKPAYNTVSTIIR